MQHVVFTYIYMSLYRSVYIYIYIHASENTCTLRFFICHGFTEAKKATFVAKAVHGLVYAAVTAADLGSLELG